MENKFRSLDCRPFSNVPPYLQTYREWIYFATLSLFQSVYFIRLKKEGIDEWLEKKEKMCKMPTTRCFSLRNDPFHLRSLTVVLIGCSSVCRLKPDSGNGPLNQLHLRNGFAVKLCEKQWLLAKSFTHNDLKMIHFSHAKPLEFLWLLQNSDLICWLFPRRKRWPEEIFNPFPLPAYLLFQLITSLKTPYWRQN